MRVHLHKLQPLFLEQGASPLATSLLGIPGFCLLSSTWASKGSYLPSGLPQ